MGAYAIGNFRGAAYVFHHVGPDRWVQDQILTAPDAESGDCFGIDVGLSNNWIAVGAIESCKTNVMVLRMPSHRA